MWRIFGLSALNEFKSQYKSDSDTLHIHYIVAFLSADI